MRRALLFPAAVLLLAALPSAAQTPAARERTCECKLEQRKDRKAPPSEICLGESIQADVQYTYVKGTGATEVIAALETVATNTTEELMTKPVLACSAAITLDPKATPTAPGLYKIVASADCAKESYVVPFTVVRLDGIEGPPRIFGAGRQEHVWTAKTTPAGSGANLQWTITGPKKGSAKPESGKGATVESTLSVPGKYKLTVTCGKTTKTKDIVVEDVKSAAVNGPSLLCFRPVGAGDGCRELPRQKPAGQWMLVVNPPRKDSPAWQIEWFREGSWKKVAEGTGLVATYGMKDPGCYRVVFRAEEGGMLALKNVLVPDINIDVVVDDDLSTTSAVPQAVPIYLERANNAFCWYLPIRICRGFPMRFRVDATPPVIRLGTAGAVAMKPDLDDKDGANRFSGFYNGPHTCDPDRTSSDFFTITPSGNGQVEITAVHPISGETFHVGRIDVRSQELPGGKFVEIRTRAVSDAAGNASEYFGNKNEPAVRVPKLFDVANTYWSQCGICFRSVPKADLPLKGANFGADVDPNEQEAIAEAAETADGSAASLLNFVHRVAEHFAFTIADANGGPMFNTAMTDPGTDGDGGVVLAHELLHGLSGLGEDHPHHPCRLDRDKVGYEHGLITRTQCSAAEALLPARKK